MAARGRNSDNASGAVIGMAIFGVISLTFIVLYALSYNEANKNLSDKKKAEKNLKEFISKAQRGSTQFTQIKAAMERSGQDTIYSQLLLMIQEKEDLIGTSRGATDAAIRTDFNISSVPAGDAEPSDQKLLTLLEQYNAVKNERDQLAMSLKTAQDARAQANATLEKSHQDQKLAQTRYKEELATGSKQLTQEIDRNKENIDEKTRIHNELVKNTETKFDALTAINNDSQNVIKAKDKTIAELKLIIEERLASKNDGKGVSIGEIKDGTIQAVVTGGESVVLSLTSRDHLKPGMTFEVYSPRTGIQFIANDDGSLKRGFATIEIKTVDEQSSTASVVRIDKGKTIQKDDWIANVAYDPKATVRFVVHGLFDLSGRGVPTAEGRKKIEAIIRNYNSMVVRELTYQTDYLVVGQKPVMPAALSDDAGQREIEIYKAAKLRFEAYNAITKRADELKVPILNQNKFMAQSGHYRR